MLTKQDYLEHLKQIEEVERKMSEVYAECAKRIEDEEFRVIFDKLLKDELRHKTMVKALMERINKP
jgi:rubrerythrin